VQELLTHSGVPLELDVARLCQKFVAENDGRHDVHVSTQRLVYGEAGPEQTYREIDQDVKFYYEVPINDDLGIVLHMDVVIECKHRKNMEAFAFAYQSNSREQAILPVSSSLARSELVRRVTRTEPTMLANLPLCAVALLEIDGAEPKKVLDEQLIYKAGASLFDYVKFELRNSPRADNPTVRLMALDDQFRAYLEENDYAWWSVARTWISQRDDGVVSEFNARYFGGRRLFHSIDIYVPVICLQSPMYLVTTGGSSGQCVFERTPISLTGVRVPGWPGSNKESIVRTSAEGLVLIATVGGLEELLRSVHQWFDAMVDELATSDDHLKKRCAIEAEFIREAIHTYSAFDNFSGMYRSNVDLDLP